MEICHGIGIALPGDWGGYWLLLPVLRKAARTALDDRNWGYSILACFHLQQEGALKPTRVHTWDGALHATRQHTHPP